MMNRHSRALAALALSSALVAAACGGGGGDDAAAPTSVATGSTTTTAGDTTTSTIAGTTTTVPPPTFVLTGLPADDPAALSRPVLGVKIDNNAAARPQVGLNQADVVYEELVEQASRYLAVFQSHQSDPVGPVRSARATDIDLMANLGTKPLFANSGGNSNVMAAVNNAPLVPVGHSSSAGNFFYRQSGRRAPHNLFVKTSDLYTKAEDESKPPASFFQFAPPGSPPPALGGPTDGVGLDFASNKAAYRWNAETQSWDRELDGTPHLDGDKVLISPENVLVMFVRYTSSSTPGSPKADTIGTGDAWVLTRGVLAPGTWTRKTAKDPYTFTDANGAPILLTPGQTWIELSQEGKARRPGPRRVTRILFVRPTRPSVDW